MLQEQGRNNLRNKTGGAGTNTDTLSFASSSLWQSLNHSLEHHMTEHVESPTLSLSFNQTSPLNKHPSDAKHSFSHCRPAWRDSFLRTVALASELPAVLGLHLRCLPRCTPNAVRLRSWSLPILFPHGGILLETMLTGATGLTGGSGNILADYLQGFSE